MKNQKTIVSLLAFAFTAMIWDASCPALASESDKTETKMPSTVNVTGRTLELNGTGLRTATLFHVKVYEAGLYLPRRSSNAQQILQSAEPKVVRLRFLRDVTAEQVRDAWKEGFEKNCESNCKELQAPLMELISRMPPAKSGDVFAYVITPQGIHVLQNGKEIDHSNNPRLGKEVLALWLGKQPPSIELKQGLLGTS